MSSLTRHRLPELYMKLLDRKKLLKLMVIQGVSQRQVALEAGWASHSYLGRLLRGDVDTLEPEPALRIARFLGVGVDDLFMPRLSSDTAHSGRSRARHGTADQPTANVPHHAATGTRTRPRSRANH
ncbi:helix-turn-helix domain-containing protein [Oerskovia jenensis]|uniref:helix-turn-helix domain-containing protein n=1 Tax=Oerskovia jenensis TaxID=162169 RepID=UPI0036D91D59